MSNRLAIARRIRIERLEQRVLFAFYGPDDTFATLGKANAPGDNVIDVLSDGNIFVVGNHQVPGTGFDDPGFNQTIASRIKPDGTLDTSFSGDGMINFDETRGAIGDGSRFYIIFELDNNSSDVRAYDSDTGELDPAFSGDGIAEIPYITPGGGTSQDATLLPHAITPDGGVLINGLVRGKNGGTQNEEFIKFKPDGSPDTSFGDNGVINTGPGGTLELSAQLTGDAFYLIKYDYGIGQTQITRYQPDGKTLDSTFGTGGTVTINAQTSVKVRSSGKILTLELSPTTLNAPVSAVLSRLNANGSLDTTFGTNGHTTINGPVGPSNTGQLALDDQGRIIVVLNAQITRYSADGIADSSAPFQGASIPGGELAFDAQGRLLVGMIDSTERFDVLSPVQVTSDHVLHVNGTDANDAITIESSAGNKIKVTLNSTVTEVDATGIVGMNVALEGGINSLLSSVDLPTSVTSGDGVDSITTGDGADSIFSGGGADVINCGDGNDTVESGGNADTSATIHTITGGDGNKVIRARSGGLTLNLGVGDNDISGGPSGANHITVAGGTNSIDVDSLNSVITVGGSGNNQILIGVHGTADIATGSGNDSFQLFGGGTIHSGAGDDSFRLSANTAIVTLFGEAGDDKVFCLNSSDIGPAEAHGGDGNDRMQGGDGTQKFYGEAGNDTLFGGGGSDLLSGGGGNDRLFGEGGNDRLYGGDGRDRLFGGNGDDRIFGGASGDWLYANTGNDQLNGEGGDDRLYADYSSGIAALHGGAGNDILVTKDGLVDQLFGDRGSDISVADATGDVLNGIETVS